MQIDLLPNFVGYLLMMKGIDELIKESEFFDKVRPWAVFMACYSGVIFILDLLGISSQLQGFSIILGIINISITLYILYQIVSGVMDIEKKYGIFLDGDKLKDLWKFMSIFNVIIYFLMFFTTLAVVLMIITIITYIIFLITFNNSKNLYYNERDKFFHS